MSTILLIAGGIAVTVWVLGTLTFRWLARRDQDRNGPRW